MEKVRKRRSFSKSVKFAPVPTDENSNEKKKAEKIKPAQRLGNYVRYGKTVFELHEDKGDSIYCNILEVSVYMCSAKHVNSTIIANIKLDQDPTILLRNNVYHCRKRYERLFYFGIKYY